MAHANSDFSDEVAELLTSNGIEFLREPTLRGISPDFVVHLSTGREIVVETKSWRPTAPNLARAATELQFFETELNALDALIVVPEMSSAEVQGDEVPERVLGASELVSHLREREGWRQKGAITLAPVEPAKPILFCAMPFDNQYSDTYYVAMRGAAEHHALAARRVDKDEFVDDILDQIVGLIRQSKVVVADLSGSNANVTWEAGYATALGIPVVYICSTALSGLPFNLRHKNVLSYAHGGTTHLLEGLIPRVASALG